MFPIIFFGGTILLGIIVLCGDFSLFSSLGIIFIGGTILGIIGLSVDKNFSNNDSESSTTTTSSQRTTSSPTSYSTPTKATTYTASNMTNDVQRIINHWKVSSSNIIENSSNRAILRFWMPMPAPKVEIGMSVYFTYVNKDSYNIVFWTDDIVKANPKNQIIINELIHTTSGSAKRFELDNDGDLRYKVGLPQIKNGESFKLFNDVLLEITKDCNVIYAELYKIEVSNY